MKASYKIALLVSAIVFLIVLALFFGQEAEPGEDIASAGDTPSETAADTSATKPEAASEKPAAKTASDLRSRVASANDDKADAPTAAGDSETRDPAATRTASPPPRRLFDLSGNNQQPQVVMQPLNTDAGETPTATNTTSAGASDSAATPPARETATFASPAATPTRTTVTTQPQPAAAATGYDTYTVESGDTFSRIAFNMYNDESQWVAIARANPRVDPLKLSVGQQLRLPRNPGAATTAAAAAASTTTSRTAATPTRPGYRTYTVEPGDSLTSISVAHYDSPNGWQRIYEANRDAIGDNPDVIPGGVTLQIPPLEN